MATRVAPSCSCKLLDGSAGLYLRGQKPVGENIDAVTLLSEPSGRDVPFGEIKKDVLNKSVDPTSHAHFDVKQYNNIIYSDLAHLERKLEARIRANRPGFRRGLCGKRFVGRARLLGMTPVDRVRLLVYTSGNSRLLRGRARTHLAACTVCSDRLRERSSVKRFKKAGGLAALGLVGAAVPALAQAQGTDVAGLVIGTWNLEQVVEGCEDATGTSVGELWTFGSDSSFARVAADGLSSETGRWLLKFDGRELRLLVDHPGQPRSVERFPIALLDATRLELLTPTQVKKGVVIRQERLVSFFHS